MLKLIEVRECYIEYEGSDELSECEEVEGSLIYNEENKVLKVKMKPINSNIDPFDLIIKEKENEFFVKTDLFSNENQVLYSAKIEELKEEYILSIYVGDNETMNICLSY